MMSKQLLALFGVSLLFVGIGYIIIHRNETRVLSNRDSTEKISEYPAGRTIVCSLGSVTVSKRIISERDTVSLTVAVLAHELDECSSVINLQSLGFDTDPSNREKEITLQPKDEAITEWILRPQQTGEFDILVSDSFRTKSVGLKVTNVLGFSPAQAEILSFIGTVLEPIMTIPWWIEFSEKRKKNTGKANGEA